MIDSATTDLSDLKDHILICGWNENLPRVLDGLINAQALENRALVLVNQSEQAPVDELRARAPQVAIYRVDGPYHSEAALKQASCATASAAIILADTLLGPDADNRTIICSLAVKNLSRDVKTCAELL
ncbi:MAG TPA: hypothetical protein VGW38_18870, partial [Chloroflexota bacterium]|nr:hypothetical protein [Chloroflexota bacterium]